MCMLIAKFSSQAHELVLPFVMGAASFRISVGLREVLSQPLEAQCPPFPRASGIMP